MWIVVHSARNGNSILINLDKVFYILGGDTRSFIYFGTQERLIEAKESKTELMKMIRAKMQP